MQWERKGSGQWALGLAAPPTSPGTARRHSRVNECPSFTDRCVCGANILCHTAGAKRPNHLPHSTRATQHQKHPAFAPTPISSAAQCPAGPHSCLEKDHETQSHGTPPEANSAKELLKWHLGFANHNTQAKDKKSGILGFKSCPLPGRHLPKGAGKAEGLCLVGTGPGTCWVSFLPTSGLGVDDEVWAAVCWPQQGLCRDKGSMPPGPDSCLSTQGLW